MSSVEAIKKERPGFVRRGIVAAGISALAVGSVSACTASQNKASIIKTETQQCPPSERLPQIVYPVAKSGAGELFLRFKHPFKNAVCDPATADVYRQTADSMTTVSKVNPVFTNLHCVTPNQVVSDIDFTLENKPFEISGITIPTGISCAEFNSSPTPTTIDVVGGSYPVK